MMTEDEKYMAVLRFMNEVMDIFVPVEAYCGPKICAMKFHPFEDLNDAMEIVTALQGKGYTVYVHFSPWGLNSTEILDRPTSDLRQKGFAESETAQESICMAVIDMMKNAEDEA